MTERGAIQPICKGEVEWDGVELDVGSVGISGGLFGCVCVSSIPMTVMCHL